MTRPRRQPSSPPRLDQATLERVRQRDREAMNVFFDHFYSRVYGYLIRLLKDQSVAEDLAQDAFLRLNRAIERLDPSRDPAPWVFTIVTNTVRDFWRSREQKQQSKLVDIDDSWEEPADAGAPSALEHLEAEDDKQRIRRALDGLAPADREILLFREYEELSTAAVAAMLQLTPEAVRQRHSRAIRRLGEAYRRLQRDEETS